MFERILVPVDFSEFSEGTVRAACELARRFKSEIHLLHVIPTLDYFAPYESFVPVANLEAVQKDVEAEVYAGLAALARFAEEVAVEKAIRQGTAFVEIIEYARGENIDLIVMATHGRSGIEQALLGSVAEKVVRRSPCPVLTFRPKGKAFSVP